MEGIDLCEAMLLGLTETAGGEVGRVVNIGGGHTNSDGQDLLCSYAVQQEQDAGHKSENRQESVEASFLVSSGRTDLLVNIANKAPQTCFSQSEIINNFDVVVGCSEVHAGGCSDDSRSVCDEASARLHHVKEAVMEETDHSSTDRNMTQCLGRPKFTQQLPRQVFMSSQTFGGSCTRGCAWSPAGDRLAAAGEDARYLV
jgi:hypothetical protein